jgi:hypothetical protein
MEVREDGQLANHLMEMCLLLKLIPRTHATKQEQKGKPAQAGDCRLSSRTRT